MPKFAIYYVPQEDDEFYRLGSSILGYDIRTQNSVQMADELREQFEYFDQEWTVLAKPYGFHLTIGDAIDFKPGDLIRIEQEMTDILNCFKQNEHFYLKLIKDDPISIWKSQIVVLRYNAGKHLKIFHDLVTARINPLGTGSIYLEEYLKNPNQYVNSPHKEQRILKFYSPNILSSYTPHFTLLNPYTGQTPEKVKLLLSKLFGQFSEIKIESICLLVQMIENENWKIHKEFKRP